MGNNVPAMRTLANGAVVPADTPAVAAAKRAHQNAVGAINPSNNAPAAIYQSQPVPTLQSLSNGAVVPADTPAVAAAKQAHYNADGALHNSVHADTPVTRA